MADINPVIVKLEADVSDLKKGLTDAQAYLKNLDSNVKRASTGLDTFKDGVKKLGATLGVTFAAGTVVSFFKQSVQASQEAEAAQARLRQLLLNTNGATEAQIVALGNQAQALEKVGVVSADNITVAQSQLATFDLSAAAIGKLTPAILNYVTAEKGAAASAEEYKQMTNGLAQALQGNFASLTRTGFVLDEATKKQIAHGSEMERAEALVKVLNSTYEGFNENLRNTSQGAMQVAINDFNNLKQEIGKGLQPAVTKFANFLTNTLFPALRNLGKFLSDNKDTIIDVSKVLAAGVTAFGLYKAAIVLTTNVSKVFTVVTTLMRGAQLASIASTNGLAASMLALNAAIKANPVGIIITAITLLVAAFVVAYKKIDWFREGVQAIFRTITNNISKFLGALATLAEAATKIPGIGDKFEGVAKSIRNASEAVKRFGENIGKTTGPLGNYAMSTGSVSPTADTGFGDGRKDKGGSALDKKIKQYAKDARAYIDKVRDIQRANADKLKDIDTDYERSKRDALLNYTRQLADIRKAAANRDIDIEQDYKKKLTELEKDYQDKISELKKEAAKKQAQIIVDGLERQRELTKTSMDRLRSDFASSVALSLADAFKDSRTSTGLLDNLKKRFTEAENLAKGAASLAAKGYSQTFIEEVIKSGPQQGMEMITEILSASPEQQAEIQKAYANLETITNSGLNTLAETMNKGGNLATQELRDAYNQVSVDVKASLAETNLALQEAMAEQLAQFDKAKVEAAKARDERLAESAKQLKDALAEADKNYMETLADLKTKYNDALADAQVDLQRSLRDAQIQYEKAIDAIAASTDAKLKSLKAKLQEIAALMAQLATLGAGTKGTTATVSPYTGGGSIDRLPYGGGGTIQNVNNYNNTINTTNLTNPQETSAMLMGMIKYGQVVQIAGNGQTPKSDLADMVV